MQSSEPDSRKVDEESTDLNQIPRSLSNLPPSRAFPSSILGYLDHRGPATSQISNQTSTSITPSSQHSSNISNVGPIRSERLDSVSPPSRHQPYLTTFSRRTPNHLLSRPSPSTSFSPAGSSLGTFSHDATRLRTSISTSTSSPTSSSSSTIPRGLLPPPNSKSSTSLLPLQIPTLPRPPSTSRSRSNSLNRIAGETQNQSFTTSPSSEWSSSVTSLGTSTSNAITLPPLLPLPGSGGRPRSVTLGRTLPPLESDFSVGTSSGARDRRQQFEGPSPPQQFEFLRERVERERRHTDNPTTSTSSRNRTSPISYNSPFLDSASRSQEVSFGQVGRNSRGNQRRVDRSSVSPILSSHWDRRVMEPDPSPRARYRTLTFHSPEWEAQGISMTLANATMNPAALAQPPSSNVTNWDRRNRETSYLPIGVGNFQNSYNSVSPSLSDSALQIRTGPPSFATIVSNPATTTSSSSNQSSSRLNMPTRSSSTSLIGSQNPNSHHQYLQSSDSSLTPSGLATSQSNPSSIGSSMSQQSSISEMATTTKTKQQQQQQKIQSTSTSTSLSSSSSSSTEPKSKSSSNNNPKLVFGSGTRSRRVPKSHVVSACVNCKSAHLACDVQRPCNRCVQLGKTDSCVDVKHKKRGRPRLFKHDESSTSTAAASIGTSNQTTSQSDTSTSTPTISNLNDSNLETMDPEVQGQRLQASGIVGSIHESQVTSRSSDDSSVFHSGNLD